MVPEQALRLACTWLDLFDQLPVAAVCKRWAGLVQDTLASVEFKHVAVPLSCDNDAFDVWGRIRFESVEALSITVTRRNAAAASRILASAPTTLRSIQLTANTSDDDIKFYDVLPLQEQLEGLFIKDLFIAPESLASIYPLTRLKHLYIESQERMLPIFMPELSALRSLESVVVIGRGATGTLDPLTHCTLLQRIVIGALGGPLRSLEFVDSTQFSASSSNGTTNLFGQIPASIGNLVHLQQLVIGPCLLSGRIPDSIGSLTDLQVLELRGCQNLSGSIPRTISHLTKLKELRLYANNLSGQLPHGLSALVELKQLTLHLNQLSGPIPPEWTNLTQLKRLSLRDNRLTGAVPPLDSLSGALIIISDNTDTLRQPRPPTREMQALRDFYHRMDGDNWDSNVGWEHVLESEAHRDAAWNPFGISTLGDDPHVLSLWLPTNGLRGRIPASIGELTHLRGIGLWYNHNITGAIPSSISRLTSLLYLYLDGNRLNGPIPECIGELSQLLELHLEKNEFTGSLPESLGSLTNLEELVLESNMLRGQLPSTLSRLTKLRLLVLNNNLFTGEIPDWLSALPELQILALNSNRFFGQIPSSLSHCSSLLHLSLDGNNLTGPVPDSFTRGLRRLVQAQLPSTLANTDQFAEHCSRTLPGLQLKFR